MDVLLHRGILGRHAEGIPAHRVQHIVAARTPEARDGVADRVVADMAHMDAPRRIGEHFENIIFGLGVRAIAGRVAGQEVAALLPDLLPFRLGGARVVTCGHGLAGSLGTGTGAEAGALALSPSACPAVRPVRAYFCSCASIVLIRSWRARTRMAFSICGPVAPETGASTHSPLSDLFWRKTATFTPSARSRLSRI